MIRFLLMYSGMHPSDQHLRRLASFDEGVEISIAENEEAAMRLAKDADCILGHRYLRQSLPHAPNLAWVQSTAAGVDHLISPALFSRAPILTRCPVLGDIIALHAVTMALALIRRIPQAITAQRQGIWSRPSDADMLPIPQTAFIMGLGVIGQQIARFLRSQGIVVRGTAKNWSAAKALCVDEFIPAANWRSALADVDLCFITLPLAKDTVNLFDREALLSLPGHAVVVNVGRARTVDMQALKQVLEAGHLGGAAIDVVYPQPLPDGDPLWQTPRLLITPHMAVFHPQRQAKIERFIEEQVQRYFAGEAMLYQVDLNELEKQSLGLKR